MYSADAVISADEAARVAPSFGTSVADGCAFFVYSLVFGFICGFFYEFLRASRRLFKHSDLLCGIEDLLFCTVFAALYICFVYCVSFGMTRVFSVFAAFGGVLIYFRTLGRIFDGLYDRLEKGPKDGKR